MRRAERSDAGQAPEGEVRMQGLRVAQLCCVFAGILCCMSQCAPGEATLQPNLAPAPMQQQGRHIARGLQDTVDALCQAPGVACVQRPADAIRLVPSPEPDPPSPGSGEESDDNTNQCL